jgi:hypothetical protein
MSQPTVGRIVHFVVDADTAKWIAIKHEGRSCNLPKAGDVLPAMIVKVWAPTYVNLHVFVDGEIPVWVTSVKFSELRPENEQRVCFWPERV